MENSQERGLRAFNWTAIGFALLQSVCALALALATAGTIVGVSILAVFSGFMQAAVAFHADWIRLPMIGIALAGALLNLWVLARLRRLRSNPASAWRRQPPDPKQLRRERVQLMVALTTLLLIVIEACLHFHNQGHI